LGGGGKEFIEMIYHIVEGLLIGKSKMAAVLKEKNITSILSTL
jgi:hypothetical protein